MSLSEWGGFLNIMLKHENAPQAQPQAPSQCAAQVRVTPEELAAAVTALQIRKEGQPGTIAISDAVEELGLDGSPEEILKEVEAQRRSAHKRLSFTSRKRKWLAGLSLSLLCFSGFGIYSATSTGAFDDSGLTPGTQPYNLEPHTLAVVSAAPKPIVFTLAEAPEGKTLYCTPYDIEMEAASRNAQEPRPNVSQPVTEMNWPVVKYGKDLYVRGWVRMPFSKEAAKISVVEVFNKPALLANPQQVTLKLNGWAGLGYQRLEPDGAGVFVFHNPRLTAHAYEKW